MDGADDALAVLRVLAHDDSLTLDRLFYAVPVASHWPFDKGELLVLDRNTRREPFGEGRKPDKWDVEIREFDSLADAQAFAAQLAE